MEWDGPWHNPDGKLFTCNRTSNRRFTRTKLKLGMMRFSDFRRSRKCNSHEKMIARHIIQRDNFLMELKEQIKRRKENEEENENQMKNNKMYCKNGNRR